jgi:phage gpG-like protein
MADVTRAGASVGGKSLFRVSISVAGEADVDRMLRGLDEAASDLSPAWPAVDAVLHQVIAQQFRSEGAHGGSPWAPLAHRTQLQRRRLGFGPAHPILRRTGTLMRSLTDSTASGALRVHLPLAYRFGSLVEYFGYHQSTAPRKVIPRRAPVQLTFDDATELMRPIRLHLTGRDSARTRRQDARLQSTFSQGPGGL